MLNLYKSKLQEGTTQKIALAHTYELRIVVLLVEESWWLCRTKTNSYSELNIIQIRQYPASGSYAY